MPRHEVNMKSTPVHFARGRLGGVACALAMLAGSTVACVSEGQIGGGGPGTAMTGGAGTGGPGTGTAGTGPVKPIDPMMPQSTTWYESLKAANCAGGGSAVPASRIWRLSSIQWKNSVAQAL